MSFQPASKDFQLVISDEFLPKLSGHQIAEWIRQDAGYCMTPFILISAENNPKMFGDLTTRGLINFYIPKPFSIAQFTAVISLSLTTFTKKAPISIKADGHSKAIEPVKTEFPIH